MRKNVTTETFVEEASKIHNNKYDYSKVVYEKMKKGVCIVCPEHGEFIQTPYKHLLGRGCPKCGVIKNSKSRTKTTENFIGKAKKIHGNKYDYSKTEYVGAHTKVCIICPEHGEFYQEPAAHLSGQGCPVCGRMSTTKSLTKSEERFIEEARKIHGDKYDYSKVKYVNTDTNVCIICPEHGEFFMQPKHHLEGCGCQKCSWEKNGDKRKSTTEDFVEKAKKIHGNRYGYSKVEYIDAHTKVCIICPKHGEFWQTPNDHLRGNGCRYCVNIQSKQEMEICNFLSENGIEFEHGSRGLIGGKEIDIFVPKLNIGIEFDGLYWHSDEFIDDKKYHLEKTISSYNLGITLIHIFEDEWREKKNLVLSKLKHLFRINKNLPRIMARKCNIKRISKNEAKEFLEKNHIQGYGKGKVKLGAFYGEKLIGVMVFREESPKTWVLNRYATDNNFVCQGVGGKLLSFFKRNYEWTKIKSFADRRWTPFDGNNLYNSLSFTLCGYTEPDYKYIVSNKRVHKFNFRKQILEKKYGFDNAMTENEMVKSIGIHKIYDCGLIKYEMVNAAKK